MLTREELEASYLNHVTQAHNHLDAARTSKSSVTKGFHIAQALTMAQLATASAMALASARVSFSGATIDRSETTPHGVLTREEYERRIKLASGAMFGKAPG